MAAPSFVEHCNAVACDGIGGRALGVIGTWLRGLGSGQEFSGLEPAPQVQLPSDCVLRWMDIYLIDRNLQYLWDPGKICSMQRWVLGILVT